MCCRCGKTLWAICYQQLWTRRMARQSGKQTIIGPRPRQATRADIGQLHNDCQWTCLQKGGLLDVHTGQVSLFNTVAVGKRNGLSLPKLSGTVAGLWMWKNPGTCQLVRVVQSFVKTISEPGCVISRQVVQLRDILSDTSHKITAKTPVTSLHASSPCFVKIISEPECLTLRQVVQLRDILSNTSQDHCQEALTGLHASSHVLSGQSVSQNV